MSGLYIDGLIAYARSFLGVPYIFGGNSRGGMDCSGFICEVLRKPGLIGGKEDLSAQGLYEKFKPIGMPLGSMKRKFPAGTLTFYGRDIDQITHVALVIDWFSVIESGGGDGTTTTVEAARAANAGVRERGIDQRKDLVAAVLPRYPWEGFIGS